MVLYVARPRHYDTGTPGPFVYSRRASQWRDYRDYWLELVEEAGVLAIAIEFAQAPLVMQLALAHSQSAYAQTPHQLG